MTQSSSHQVHYICDAFEADKQWVLWHAISFLQGLSASVIADIKVLDTVVKPLIENLPSMFQQNILFELPPVSYFWEWYSLLRIFTITLLQTFVSLVLSILIL